MMTKGTQENRFGKALRPLFFLEEGFVPLNHGSFGTCPRSLHPILHDFQVQSELQPDRFLRHLMVDGCSKSRQVLSQLVHCDPEELAMIFNASYGINTVVRSLRFNRGDKIICFSTLYNAVERTMAFLKDTREVELVMIELEYPLTNQEISNIFKDTVQRERAKDAGVPIRMAIFDAISSVPGVRFPFEDIIKLCQEYGILSVVDGAHAVGQIPLNLHESDPDFFISNCHKWLFAPRGSAFLYVPRRNQALVHPSIINYAYADHTKDHLDVSFRAEFSWPGTTDFSTHLCIPAALDFRKALGGEEAIQNYCNNLAREGGQRLADIWGTQVLENDDKTLTVAMTNVQLPFKNKQNLPVAVVMKSIIDKLIYEHRTVASPYSHNGKWWLRVCAHVYNDISDFEYLSQAVIKVCQELENDP
ncbi:pyridoxal phosphate-dependent transferase [Dichotomocladium elegans]|nr:pyridoxal phosphate-dependent transferase [Dichotomocladium elegans]